MTAPDPNAHPQQPAGTDPDATAAAGGGGAGTDDRQPAGADALGDAGKKALDAMKAERNAARQQNRAVIDALATTFGRTPEQVRDLISTGKLADLAPPTTNTGAAAGGGSAGDAGQPDVQRLVADAQRAAAKSANARIIRAELKAAAAGRLADVSDVVLIDAGRFEVDDDGNVDAAELADAIEELITRKPHLAAQRGPTFGSADAGVRNGSTPGQLTETDLKRMTPEQIVEAQDKGLLKDLLGG